MALGRPDLEMFYRKCLKPAIRHVGMTPARVTDVDHNDDVDNKIIDLLDAADVVVADLTYARPSVYYEAGYAAPAPVIYTCRADHLDAPTDTLRVHFDLQMKNIIKWRTPNDPVFSRTLERRLQRVILPILHGKEKERRDDQARQRFHQLPLTERATKIIEALTECLKEEGVGIERLRPVVDWFRSLPWGEYAPLYKFFGRLWKSGLPVTGTRKGAKGLDAFFVHVGTVTGHRQMKEVLEAIRAVPFYEVSPARVIPHVNEHIVVCSSESVNMSAVTRLVPQAERTGPKELRWEQCGLTTKARLPRGTKIYTRQLDCDSGFRIGNLEVWHPSTKVVAPTLEDDVRFRRLIHVHFIDKIATESDAKNRLQTILENHSPA